MLGKLHPDPGDEEQGTEDQDESTTKNCAQDHVQSVSPIELSEASHPRDDGKTARAVFVGPKLARLWAIGHLSVDGTLNSVGLVHFSSDSILEISSRLHSLEACHQEALRNDALAAH
jgi:hypothetical protein